MTLKEINIFSGQRNHCLEGKELIKKLVLAASGRVEILVAGRVNADVIKELWTDTKATCYHMSGKRENRF